MTSTLTFPPLNTDGIERILARREPDHVSVIVAAPGVGKSTLTRSVLAHHLKAGRLRRVLWAVQAINEPDSLGAQAQQDFQDLGIHTETIYSSARCDELGKPYLPQFQWPDHPAVKIVSHAKLPLIFGARHASMSLRQADLLVIDEDPTAGLLLSYEQVLPGAAPMHLKALPEEDPVWQALQKVAEGARRSDTRTFALPNRFIRGYGLFGSPFWAAFQAHHPGPVDVLALKKTLARFVRSQQAVWLAQAFAEDAALVAGGRGNGQPTAAATLRSALARGQGALCPYPVAVQPAPPPPVRAADSRAGRLRERDLLPGTLPGSGTGDPARVRAGRQAGSGVQPPAARQLPA
ncbi:hypothetical protein [Deinococcus phoenicis]|uniref:hypothetical protein n=1 Tax=Deinococcus phoenicis TaxID=1476583 RepID=UPI0012697699|nr:hypothetical protein [Deinococcus phoenicis]